MAEGRDHRVGHRDRAADPGLGLAEAHEGGAPGDMRADAGLAPGQRVQLVGDARPEQLVPGGVELDLVDAVAVGTQLRRVLVGEPPKLDRALGTGERADLGDPLLGPVGAFAPHRLDQRAVGLEDVVVRQWGRLVGDLVGQGAGASFDRGHAPMIAAERALGRQIGSNAALARHFLRAFIDRFF